MSAAAPPRATYRLQFSRDFTFRHATKLVDYLAELGISHLYASPFLEARPGSMHGYDIIDHNRLNPEIGTAEDFDALTDALRVHGMGLILDFVPNHMGVGGKDNAWWLDVLEWGENSPYAPFFDIDWEASRADLNGKVLLPLLGDSYGVILTKGEIVLRFDPEEGSISAWYYDHRCPISPTEYADLLGLADPPDGGGDELDRIVTEFARLGAETRRRWRPGIRDEVTGLKGELSKLCAAEPVLAGAIGEAIAGVNGRPGERRSWRTLHGLLERQAYRLAYWRVAADEINYRRFFNINDLAGLRVELPELFDRMHRLVLELAAADKIQGLRIDHIDGLFDPREYCERLQAKAGKPLYVVVEKILAAHERLPDWPVAGTTGYDFTNDVLGLFVDPDGEPALTRRYARLARRDEDFDEVLIESKKRIMQVTLASEMNVLAHEFHRLAMSDWRSRDFTLNGMRSALEDVVAWFPVYRTYVDRRGASDKDRNTIEWAIARAKRRSPGTDTSIFGFIARVLTGDIGARRDGVSRADALRLAMRFQQVTGPVMAKGFEDTALYRYVRLLAQNEVGGDPRRFGVGVDEFHRINGARLTHWPDTLLATATHDTKRGEDARVRLALLSEMPRQWGRWVAEWRRLARTRRGEAPALDPNDEYLFYQAVIGAWPIDLAAGNAEAVDDFAKRVTAYMTKAIREGKERSSWANPDSEYETVLTKFVRDALDATEPNPLLDELAAAADRLARAGTINSLTQTLIKLTAPGIPDIYQGCELWDFSFVDPDNRRRVDWDCRRRLLEEMRSGPNPADLSREWPDGREKLFLISKALRLRADQPALFAEGAYVPVDLEGQRRNHIIAYMRTHRDKRILVAAPRLVLRLREEGGVAPWGDTALVLGKERRWRNILTGHEIAASRLAVDELLSDFPVALLATI